MQNQMTRRMVVLAALVLAATESSALAQSVATFLGGSGSTSTSQQSWTQPGNWDTGVVPSGTNVWAQINSNTTPILRILYTSTAIGGGVSGTSLSVGAISFLPTMVATSSTFSIQNNGTSAGAKGTLKFYGIDTTVGGVPRRLILDNSTTFNEVAFTQTNQGQEFELNTSGAINVAGNTQLSLSTMIRQDGTARTLTKIGDGVLSFAGTGNQSQLSTYSGGFVLDGGVVQWALSGTAGVGTPFGLGSLTLRSGVVRSSGTSGRSIHSSVVLDGTTTIGSTVPGFTGSITVTSSGNTTIARTSGLTIADGVTTDWQQAMSGTGRLTKSGGGILQLSGSSQFSTNPGGFVMAGGIVQWTNSGSAGANTPFGVGTLTLRSGTLRSSGTTSRSINTSVVLDGAATLGSTEPGVTGDITVNSAGGSLTTTLASDSIVSIAGGSTAWHQSVSGSASLTKAGAGTLRFSGIGGSLAYTGSTVVQAGTLIMDGRLTAPAATVVQAGATLQGSGTITGPTSIQADATLAPGTGPGMLTLGNVTWNAGGNYNWQILSGSGAAGAADTWDLVAASGTLAIAATSVNPFRLNLWSLSGTAPDTSGPAYDFSPTQRSYVWPIAAATGGISGFAANRFQINTAAANGTGGFANDLAGGSFSVAQVGNTLALIFTSTAAAPTITINVTSGTQTQAQAGWPLLSGTYPVTKTGGGTLVVDQANTLTGSTTVQTGRLQLANGAALGSSRVVPLAGGTVALSAGLQTTVGGLAANAGGLVDVGNGMVTVAAGLSATDMVTALVSGLGDGSWNGTSGITSSVAAASGGDRTVGWLDNGDGTVTFAFAAAGDTNLDWQVDILDAANFLSGGKFDSGTPASWNQGDFTYDGFVDILDAASFLSNGLFDAGAYNAAPGMAGGVAAVPEPTSAGAIVIVAALGLCRAGRRRLLFRR